MVDLVDGVCKVIPCRKNQVQQMISLFGEPDDVTSASFFIYGHTATGKSSVVKEVLTQSNVSHVLVNCVECYTGRLLYEHILNELSGVKPTPENGFSTYTRCDNANDFVHHLTDVLQARKNPTHTAYIVLDHAERLRDMTANIIPAFLRLQELSRLNICVLMISEIVWEKFRTGTGFVEPIRIHFPDYSKDEILTILTSERPDDYPVDFYRNYISLLLSVFHLVCKDVRELQHLARLNFPKYTEPILTEEVEMNETRKLWKNIEPHLKKALQTVYLREVSSTQWEQMQQQQETDPVTSVVSSHNTAPRALVELPFYGKYLLIAAYLASYNPAKCDKRFFVRRTERLGKRAKLATMKKSERTSNQLLGPKPFPLDRLLAIFYSIVEGKVAPTANIFSQISSLVTHGLLIQIATADHIDSPKYKCIVSLEFVKGIGRTVNFEVARYLYDFV